MYTIEINDPRQLLVSTLIFSAVLMVGGITYRIIRNEREIYGVGITEVVFFMTVLLCMAFLFDLIGHVNITFSNDYSTT
jgi:hypothetical protein